MPLMNTKHGFKTDYLYIEKSRLYESFFVIVRIWVHVFGLRVYGFTSSRVCALTGSTGLMGKNLLKGVMITDTSPFNS